MFHDINGNRDLEENEPGIADVAVSNGVDVVLTDETGHYELPISEDAIVFVIKPRDWMTPLNEHHLPVFHYIHKPGGSPKHFKYRGVSPTGPLPTRVNFPLYPEESTHQFKAVFFGDPQPYNIEQVDFVAEDIVGELIGREDLEFGMTLGDIVGDDLELFSPLNQAVAQIGIPWYNVLGNHDMNFEATRDELSDETYERVYGPATYAFVYGEVHFIVVDDVIHKNRNGERSYVGGLRPDQLAFVRNYLSTVSRDDLIVLTMHIPLTMHGETFRQSDQKALFDLLKAFPHTLSISAHTHVQEHKFFGADSTDWSQPQPHHHFNVGTTSGSWWQGMRNELDVPHTMMRDGTPNGYSIIEFKGTEYLIDWKVAGSPESHRMNIHLPRGVEANSEAEVLLTVNYFNGSEKTKVYYRMAGEDDWQQMEKVMQPDPYYMKLKAKWDAIKKLELEKRWQADSSLQVKFPGRKLPNPQICTHLWQSKLGNDLPVGRHLIEVRVIDRRGRIFTDWHTVRVKASTE